MMAKRHVDNRFSSFFLHQNQNTCERQNLFRFYKSTVIHIYNLSIIGEIIYVAISLMLISILTGFSKLVQRWDDDLEIAGSRPFFFNMKNILGLPLIFGDTQLE